MYEAVEGQAWPDRPLLDQVFLQPLKQTVEAIARIGRAILAPDDGLAFVVVWLVENVRELISLEDRDFDTVFALLVSGGVDGARIAGDIDNVLLPKAAEVGQCDGAAVSQGDAGDVVYQRAVGHLFYHVFSGCRDMTPSVLLAKDDAVLMRTVRFGDHVYDTHDLRPASPDVGY